MTLNVAVEAAPIVETASFSREHLPEHPANPRSTALIPYVDPSTFFPISFKEVRVSRPPVNALRESDHSGGSPLDEALMDSSEHRMLATVSGETVFRDLHVSGPPSKARRKTAPSKGSSPRPSVAVSEGSVVVVSGAGGVMDIVPSPRTKLKLIKSTFVLDGARAVSWPWEQNLQYDGNVRFGAHSSEARENRHLGAAPIAIPRHRDLSHHGRRPSEQLVGGSLVTPSLFSSPLQRDQVPLKEGVRKSRSRPVGASTRSFFARPVMGGLMRLLRMPWGVSSWTEEY